MHNFTTSGGQFMLDGVPQLVQAGEFHYFRTPQPEWRQRLGLLKDAGFNAVAAYIPWLWHQVEEGEGGSDFDGHSHPLRDLAGFLDLAAEMGLYIIARPGPYIMAETIHEGIPAWVFSHYPQVAFISQDESVQNYVSYLHPDFLACAKAWYQAVFGILAPRQVNRGGKIIMIQLDNEMGMLQWVRNNIDLNPDTLKRFAAYLQQTPGLSGIYPADDLPAHLRAGLRDPSRPGAAALVEDYRRFYRQYLRDYASFLWTEARQDGMDVPPVVNIHGFGNGGKTFPIGLSQLVEVMRLPGMVSATDVYPIFIGEGNFHQLLLVNEMTKALQNPGQALFSIEFQAGGNNDFSGSQSSLYDLHSRLCISSGMRAINHYLFCDGENDPLLSPVRRHDWGHPVRKDGSLRQHYHRYPRLSRALAAYGLDLVLAQPVYSTAIGFVLDYFMTEVNTAATQEASRILTYQRDMVLFDFIARGLALTHRPFTALDLERAPLDPAQTPLCWVMLEKPCSPVVQQKLVDYARAGGQLVLAGRLCVEDFNHAPCTLLQDALGIRQVQSEPPFTPSRMRGFGFDEIPAAFIETYQGDFTEVLATAADGAACALLQNLGQGRVLLFGASLPANTLDDLDLVRQVADRLSCPPQFKLSSWADVRLSRGPRGSFLYINNYLDDPIETTLEYAGNLLFAGQALRLPARQGMILPLEWQLNPQVLVHYLTAELAGVEQTAQGLTLRTQQAEFIAELTLEGYTCEQTEQLVTLQSKGAAQRLRLQGSSGTIVLVKA